ncbi:MAG: iron(III) transport system substrate-binding protein [Alphaproteobacteria bacterium]|nr:iron(III) transport system substrate-binding protein [Alphaproteobacteria bacterium]
MAKGQHLDYHFEMTSLVRPATALGLAALACLGTFAAAGAEPVGVAAIANYTGADRQQVLEAGARREGSLLLYTTGTQIKPLLDRFEQKYPAIRIELARASSADTARKVLEEYQAGFEKVDAFELASHGLVIPRDETILQPFQSPELAAFSADAVEAGRHWVVVRESYTGIGYNTKLLPADKAPKTYQALLDPEWKGRMALSGVSTTAVNWVGTMVIVHGADFVRKLGQQNIRLYQLTGRALANLMLAGEVALSPTIYNSHVAASADKGAPLGWLAPGPVPVTDSGVAIARKAPHPHAAMLLVDFLMSREAAGLYQELGYDSPRRDSAKPGAAVEKLYLTNRPAFIREYEGWAKLYQEVFVRRRP